MIDLSVENGSKKHLGDFTVPILNILPYVTFTNVVLFASTIRQMNRMIWTSSSFITVVVKKIAPFHSKFMDWVMVFQGTGFASEGELDSHVNGLSIPFINSTSRGTPYSVTLEMTY